MSLGPTLPAASVVSFKDLLMGIDLEPSNALQQIKKRERENYSPSGERKMTSMEWEINEGKWREPTGLPSGSLQAGS